MSEKEPIRSVDNEIRIEEHAIEDGVEVLSVQGSAKVERRRTDYDLNRANKEAAQEKENLEAAKNERAENYRDQESFLQLIDEVNSLEEAGGDKGVLHFIEKSSAAMVKGDDEQLVASSLKLDEIIKSYPFSSDEQRTLVEEGVEEQIQKHAEFYSKNDDMSNIEFSSPDGRVNKNEYFRSMADEWEGYNQQIKEHGAKLAGLEEAVIELEEGREDLLRREHGELPLDRLDQAGDVEKMHVDDMSLMEMTSALAEAYYNDDLTRAEDVDAKLKQRLAEKYPDDLAMQEEMHSRYYKLAEADLDNISQYRSVGGEQEGADDAVEVQISDTVEAEDGAKAAEVVDNSEQLQGLFESYGGMLDKLAQEHETVSIEYMTGLGVLLDNIANNNELADEDKLAVRDYLHKYSEQLSGGAVVEEQEGTSQIIEVAVEEAEAEEEAADGSSSKEKQESKEGGEVTKIYVEGLIVNNNKFLDQLYEKYGVEGDTFRSEVDKLLNEVAEITGVTDKDRQNIRNNILSHVEELANKAEEEASKEAEADTVFEQRATSFENEEDAERQEAVTSDKKKAGFFTRVFKSGNLSNSSTRSMGTSGGASDSKKVRNGLLGAFLAWLGN